MSACDAYWNSHGCDLTAGHDGPHVCGDDGEPHDRAWIDDEGRGWSQDWRGPGDDDWSEPWRASIHGQAVRP